MSSKFERGYQELREVFQELCNADLLSDAQLNQINQSLTIMVDEFVHLKGTDTKIELPFSESEFAEAWALWKKYKKQQFNFTYKPIGEEKALKDLFELSMGDYKLAIKLIDHAISKTWQGIHKIKDLNNGTSGNTNHRHNQRYKIGKKTYSGKNKSQ